jgi:hypothetical protein
MDEMQNWGIGEWEMRCMDEMQNGGMGEWEMKCRMGGMGENTE